MPITVLHFGVMAPINHLKPKKVSSFTFVMINVWIDLAAIIEVSTGVPMGNWHGPGTHSFIGASISAAFFSLFFLLSKNRLVYIYGMFLGAWSHIVLDMFCHSDMEPLFPWAANNPFYLSNGLTWVSYIMMPLFVWWLFQEVHQQRQAFYQMFKTRKRNVLSKISIKH